MVNLTPALALETVPPDVRSEAKAAYYAAHAAAAKCLSSSKIHEDTTAWRKWDSFFRWIQIPPDLHGINDPVLFLQIFAHKVCTGVLAVKNKAIKKRILKQYIRYVVQIFVGVGTPDP